MSSIRFNDTVMMDGEKLLPFPLIAESREMTDVIDLVIIIL